MLSKILVPIGVLVLVIVIGIKILFTPQKPIVQKDLPTLAWNAVQVTDQSSPPNYEVDIFLTGDGLDQIQAIEINTELLGENIQLISVDTGGFYNNPLTIKMDTEKMVFALAKNPGSTELVDQTKPIIKLYFESKPGFNQSVLKVLDKSQVYIKNTGGTYPTGAQTLIK